MYYYLYVLQHVKCCLCERSKRVEWMCKEHNGGWVNWLQNINVWCCVSPFYNFLIVSNFSNRKKEFCLMSKVPNFVWQIHFLTFVLYQLILLSCHNLNQLESYPIIVFVLLYLFSILDLHENVINFNSNNSLLNILFKFVIRQLEIVL
jgi:hypothetical protein